MGSMSLAVLVYTITGVTELTGVIRVTGASGVRVTSVIWVWVNMVTNLIILKLSKNEESYSFLQMQTHHFIWSVKNVGYIYFGLSAAYNEHI